MNVNRLVLAGHVLVSFVFLGTAVRYALAGEPVGGGLYAVIGVLVIGLGVAIARVLERR